MFSTFQDIAARLARRASKQIAIPFAHLRSRIMQCAVLVGLALAATTGNAFAACTGAPGTDAGASISFTSVGQTVSICLDPTTADHARWGVYRAMGVQSNFNYPIGNTAGTVDGEIFTYADYVYSTGNAVYLLHPVQGNAVGHEEIQITLQSQSAVGADAMTLYWSSYCSDADNSCTGPKATRADGLQFATGETTNPFSISVTSLPSVPAVTGVSPNSGPTAGANSVVITGTGMAGATGAGGVKFGANNATSYTIDSSTQITAVAPAGGVGTVDVRVTSPSGTSAITSADQYTYAAAPTATSMDIVTGPVAGGTAVTVSGSNFIAGSTSITIGGTTVPPGGVTVNSASSLTFSTPSHIAGNVAVTVTTPGGTTAAIPGGFTYLNAPTTASLSPAFGSSAGGTLITVSGGNFIAGATSVTIGGTLVSFGSVTVNSANSLTFSAPSHAAGNVSVTVTTTGGTSGGVPGGFTYEDAPTAASLTPLSGPLAGGTAVTVTGTNFVAGDTSVTIGGTTIPPGSVTVNSATSLTFATPAHAAGNVAVAVTTSGGASGSIPGGFTYLQPPAITSISPTFGAGSGGTIVTITGSNFSNATAVSFGVNAATTFSIDSSTQITVTSPAGNGQVDIRITTPGGVSAVTAADQFTYIAAPTVTSISPAAGPQLGGTVVTITGTNFTGVTAVAFGANAATGFTFNSSTSITATAPAGTGVVDIRVTTAGGASAVTAGDQFSYIAQPTISSVAPSSGPLAGGTPVTITGNGFSGATGVTFGSAPATGVTVVSGTTITATSPAGTGTVDVRVTTVGGTSAIVPADQFVYLPAPTITSVAPGVGPQGGGTAVTITGTGFTATSTVSFGAVAAAAITFNSATSITATSPPGSGTVDIRVSNQGGTSAISAADQFTYVAGPAVTSISPTQGPASGGTVVTITGTGLTGATAVKFGATNATGFTVNSATSITATSPAGAGVVDVTVSTVGGTSPASAADQFTYLAAPTIIAVAPNSGPATGGTTVTITGTDFSGASAVKFGAANAAGFTVNSATSITAQSPPGVGMVDITVISNAQTSAVSAADRFAYQAATSQTALTSSKNPIEAGQAVTFTATVTGAGAAPTGTVTFNDNGVAIGTAPLSGGVAIFTTTSLAIGAHPITAVYGGSPTYAASTSSTLTQNVNVPADSTRLRALQVNVTKMVAQNSGQAISGAIDTAIAEGFSDGGGQFTSPSANGVRFNFAADDADTDDNGGARAYASSGSAGGSGSAQQGRGRGSRIDNAFAALDKPATKAPPLKFREHKEWMFWTEVRGSGVDRWGSTPTNVGFSATEANLRGAQLNLLAGLTYRPVTNVLVGVLGGYETFSYTQQDINGKLKGDGWTVGAYLGWKITPSLRWDAAVAYSGIGYDGTAGTAQGNFDGVRWLASTGLTGTYKFDGGLLIEPSLKVYALWERENAYTDSLGTLQAARNFSTGRASTGAKFAYPLGWWDSVQLVPFVGIYGDYYFTQDDAVAIVAAGGIPLASTPLLDGWSARMTGGVGARFENGILLTAGGELGGIGNGTRVWTVTGRAKVPFAAQ